MAVKQLEVEGIGAVSLYKRKGTRTIRISLTHKGDVRVTLPIWIPYASAMKFVESRKDWIMSERPQVALVTQGYSVGKAHHIEFESGSGVKVSSRITGNQVRVLLPIGTKWDSPEAQTTAHSAAIKALKKEAKMLLPHRLKTLAEKFNFEYKDVAVKQLKGRWGSCDQDKHIILNCFLMQLPWELIDYVILHELVHTRVMAHGPAFWAQMESVSPEVQKLRKLIKTHKPVL